MPQPPSDDAPAERDDLADPGAADAPRDLGGPDEVDAPRDPDDLDEVETSMSRLVAHARGWLAAVVAVSLLVPFGGWLIDEYVFEAAGSDVEEALGGEAALVEAMLLVRSTDCAGTTSTGSAFVLDVEGRTVVVTNRHVVEGAASIGVRPLTGGAAMRVVAHRIASTADVAVLELGDAETPAGDPLRVGRPAADGEGVRVVGFPSGRPTLTSGVVEEASPRRLLLDLRVDPGASGSPALDDEGRVVGQVFARTSDGRGVATPLDALLDAIDGATAQDFCDQGPARS